MSAELLRKAAALMRERAKVATPGPWRATDEGLTHPGVGLDVASPSGSVASECCGYQGACGPEDAAHIASWHPAVVLAVADWLDEAADHLDVYEDDDLEPALRPHVCPTALEGTECSVLGQALTVARVYLGEDA